MCAPCLDFWCTCVCNTKKHAPRDTFFRNHKQNRVTGMSLSHLQTMPIYYILEKYILSIRCFKKHCATIVLEHNIFCAPQKDVVWCMTQTCTFFFSALNLIVICIKSVTYNSTNLSASFINEIIFLNFF